MVTSVLIILKHLIYGGAEKYTLNLANSLAEKGITVTLVSGDGPLAGHISPKVNLFIMPISRSPRIKQITEKRILEIARECKPQIIHTQCRISMLNSQLARDTLGIPLITHEHHMYTPEEYPLVVNEIRDGADQVITIGPYTAQALIREGLLKSTITPILNGIDLKNTPLISDQEREQARKILGIEPTDKVALCISRLEPGKGIDKLAKAFIQVVDHVPSAKLFIVGDDATGETEIYIKQLTKEYGLEKHIFLLRGEYDIRKYHAAADVFCYPALGKGMAVMEAMAAGLPVIGKRTTRKPLVVEHAVSGLMTEPSEQYPIDPSQITEKLIYLLEEPEIARTMGRAARKRIERKFTLEKVVSNVLKAYRNTIDTYDLSPRNTRQYDLPALNLYE